jgi:glycerol uptake facilitator-like aquaporin
MDDRYVYEFIGTLILAFLIGFLGKGYAHVLFGMMVLVSGSIFVVNCFNPAIALGFLVTNKIQIHTFLYYIVIESIAAIIGYYSGKYIHNHPL